MMMKLLPTVLTGFLSFFLIFGTGRAGTLINNWSTYLGGTAGGDQGHAVAVDLSGAVYVAGETDSLDFPTADAYQASRAASVDGFVAKFSSGGTSLVYSTYLGGSLVDRCYGISVDYAGSACVAGTTNSSDFPLESPYQGAPGGNDDAFVTKLTPSGSGLVYSTYFGGASTDSGEDIALDGDGSSYVAGWTYSTDFPVENPYQSSMAGGCDAFVFKLPADGSSLTYSSYLGGSTWDYGYGVAVGTDGSAWAVGETQSSDFPTENPYQSTKNSAADAFVSKLAPSGSELVYSSFLGGNGAETAYDVTASAGEAFLTGYTSSADFPTANPCQPSYAGGSDVFISRLDSAGTTLLNSTYLGGSLNEYGRGVAVVSTGDIYVSGYTNSTDFPTVYPLQAAKGTGDDIFVSKLAAGGSALIYSTYLGGNGHDKGRDVAAPGVNIACVTGSTKSTDFPTANPYQPGLLGTMDAVVSRLEYLITPTPSATPTATPSMTPTPTLSASPTPSPSVTASPAPSATPTPTPTATPPPSPSVTPTPSVVPPPAAPSWITDYNGDGTSDIAVFRPASGLWAIRRVTRAYFGSSADIAVPGDFEGDGTTDIGIFRDSSGLWAVRGVTRAYFGGSADEPVAGDYEGRGTAGVAIFRPASGLWAVRGLTRIYFGTSTDRQVAGYWAGDGRKSPAIFRPALGLWAVRGITRVYFGSSADEPVPGDYAGTGSWGPAIFREAIGLWAVKGVTRAYFGSSADSPVPGGYRGDGKDCIGVFRGSSGLWAVNGVTRVYFGGSSDIPVTR